MQPAAAAVVSSSCFVKGGLAAFENAIVQRKTSRMSPRRLAIDNLASPQQGAHAV